jgi:hypothetical protein
MGSPAYCENKQLDASVLPFSSLLKDWATTVSVL